MSKNFNPRLLLDRWRSNPVLFPREALGIELWEAPPREIRHAPHGQADILRGFGHKFSSIMSGRKTGKSTGLVCRGIHWMLVKPRPCVIFTAPTYRQVKRPLWEEFNRVYRSSRIPLGGTVAKTPENGWTTARGQMFGMSTDDPDNLRGPSGSDQLYLVDEASGFSEPLFEAIVGNLMGGGECAIAFNPTNTVGFAFDSFHTKAEMYFQVNLSSLDTPNMTGLGMSCPGFANPPDVEEAKLLWGDDSPSWQVHILGRFPSGAINTIITLQMWQDACARWDDEETGAPLSIGVDPAGFGDDDAIISPLRGKKAYPQTCMHSSTGPDIAGKVLEVIADHRRHSVERVKVKVDVTGEGASCFDSLDLASEAHGIDLFGINNSGSPTSQPSIGPGYANMGAQLWFAARDWFKGGGMIDNPDPQELRKLQGELTGRTYSFDAQGRYVLEPKKDFKKRIGRSPDRADGLTLAIHDPPPIGQVRVRGQRKTARGFGGF